MSQDRIKHWLDDHRRTFVDRFVEAASRFPGYDRLDKPQLRLLMQREVLGLVSHMSGQREGLKEATETHRQHAEDLTMEIPVAEQLDFLDERTRIVIELIRADPAMASLCQDFCDQLERAKKFYRTMIRAIEFDRRDATHSAA